MFLINIGHASCLVQMSGLSFLTDPVFCERASMVQFAGPKRYVKVPFTLAELRKVIDIDFVVISHNHYDHLDASTVAALSNETLWFVPKQLKSWFTDQNINNVVDLDW
jgi:N-acyl-phosphatidylethanolamine-hydrolysing phospholipase D